MYLPLWNKVGELIYRARNEDIDVGLFCGTRTFGQQAELYAKGRTLPGEIVTNAKPGYSWHNYGLAADISFLTKGEWDWTKDFKPLGKLGKELGLEWGGDWENFKDMGHFQITHGLHIEEAFRIFGKFNKVEDVWTAVEQK